MNENRRRPNRQPVYRAPIFLFRNFKVLINNSRESSLDESQGGQKWESATRADKYLHAQRGIVRTHCRMYATGMCVSAFSFSLSSSLLLFLSRLCLVCLGISFAGETGHAALITHYGIGTSLEYFRTATPSELTSIMFRSVMGRIESQLSLSRHTHWIPAREFI